MIAKIRLIVFIAAACSGSAYGLEQPSNEQLSAAKALVGEYKELRKSCALAVDEERKVCFRELNDVNTQYKAAKMLLASLHKHNDNNLHLVSQAY